MRRNGIAVEAGHTRKGGVVADENETIVELAECFMNDQRVILRAVVMNAIEKAILNGLSPEDVNDAIRPLLGYSCSKQKN